MKAPQVQLVHKPLLLDNKSPDIQADTLDILDKLGIIGIFDTLRILDKLFVFL